LISGIKKLGLTTTSYPELISESLGDVIAYLLKFMKKIEQNDIEVISKNAAEGISWINENVKLLSALYDIDISIFPDKNKSIKNLLDEILIEYSEIDKLKNDQDKITKFKQNNKNKISQLYQSVLLMAREIKNKIQVSNIVNYKYSLVNIKSEIKDVLDKDIMNLSTNIQTGKEKEAMNSVQRISLIMEKLIKIFQGIELQYAVDYNNVQLNGQNLKSWIEHLMKIGNEIIDAFKNNDTVLIADLFEYEFGETFSQAEGFIDQVLSQIKD
ncbi:MAG: hypothetical protein KAR07_08000, partial [Spirochaetes bacterium]|nr:hypothetical protein [Spirochaetota bacterium]